jgi:hypothetical protein
MATFQAQVSQSSDDVAGQNAGNVTSTLIYQDAGIVGQYGGYRFQNVTIPTGSTITAASLDVYVQNTSYDSPNLELYCQAADNPDTFTDGEDWFTATRSWTTAKGTWNATDIGTGWKTTADFAAALQEVIDRPGWTSGNAVVVGTKSLSGCVLRLRTYDNTTGGIGTNAAYFNVTYTPPASAKPAIYYAMMGTN